MKKLLLFMVAVTSIVHGQPPPAVSGRTTGEVKKFSGWPSINGNSTDWLFVSLEGRFSIALPKNVQGFAALSPKQTGTTASGQEFTWKFVEVEITGLFLDFPDSNLTGSAANLSQITTNAKKLVTDRLSNTKLISESEYELNGIPTASYFYDLGTEGLLSVQLYLDKKRLYRFSAVFKDRSTEPFLNKVFQSFKLISQTDVDAELQRRYDSMKPPPLPQAPVVRRLSTDAEDANLKGKVKKIVEESEDLSGTWSVQGRKLSSVVYYDPAGALVQRDSYDSQGNPFQITVYGYIDGKRVSSSKMTRYEYDPPPAASPRALGPETANNPDTRYEYSFEYKYDKGKLTERQMFYSNGKKGMCYVYIHAPSQFEELVYTDEGKLNQRYLSILDEKGNVTERTDFGVVNFDIYGDRKYRYAYEFDASGNWIKRLTSKVITENGVTKVIPYSVSYRAITYY